MPKIEMYTTAWCAYCVRAKVLLDARGLEYEEISLDDDPEFRRRLLELTGRWTVPTSGYEKGGVDPALSFRPHFPWPRFLRSFRIRNR